MGSKAPQPIPPSYAFMRLVNVKGYDPDMLHGVSERIIEAVYRQEFGRPVEKRPVSPPPPPKRSACGCGRCP
jgi:hypothetical protein